MKADDVRKLSDEEIQTEVKRLRKELFNSRAKAVTQKVEKPSDWGLMRRDVARMLTEQRTRQLKKQKV